MTRVVWRPLTTHRQKPVLMKDFKDVWSLLSHVEARLGDGSHALGGGQLNDVAMGAFFVQTGKLLERDRQTLDAVQEERVRRLCGRIQHGIEKGNGWGAKALCDTMSGMAKMGLKPSDDFVRVWGRVVHGKLAEMEGSQLASLVYALGKLEVDPLLLDREWFADWAELCVAARFKDFSAQALSTSIWGLSKLKLDISWLGTEFFPLWAKASRAGFVSFTAQNLSIALYSVAILGLKQEHLGEEFVKQWCVVMRPRLMEAAPQNLANSMYALALLDVSQLPGKDFLSFLDEWAAACHTMWTRFSPQNLANIIWAMGKLLADEPLQGNIFYQGWAAACLPHFAAFNQQNLSNCIWGVARLNLGPSVIGTAWYASWSYECSRQLQMFTTQGLANTWWALATLEMDASIIGGKEFYKLLAHSSEGRWADFGEQELSNALWALGKLDLGESVIELSVFTSWLGAAAPRLALFGPQAISNVIWALGKLDLNGTKVGSCAGWFRLWNVACMERLHEMSPQSLANTIYGVARLQLGYEELDRRFFSRWAKACLPQLPLMTPQGLGNVIYSVANLNLLQGNLAPTFVMEWSHASVSQMKHFYPQSLSMAIDGVAGLELCNTADLAPGFVEGWTRVCMREISNLNTEDLALIVAALGDLRWPVEAGLCNALALACQQKQGTFKMSQLARALTGFAFMEAGGLPLSHSGGMVSWAREVVARLEKAELLVYKTQLGAAWFHAPVARMERRPQGRAESLVVQMSKVLGPSYARNAMALNDLVQVDLLDADRCVAIFVDDDRRYMTPSSSQVLKSVHVLEQKILERAGFKVKRFPGKSWENFTPSEIKKMLD